ncbi:MAG: discoidin domain-containing protein [Micromonosporaceae bacterium]
MRTLLRRSAIVVSLAVAITLLPGLPAHAVVRAPVAAVTASSHDGNVPSNTLDGSLSTRWSANGDGEWIRYDLNAPRRITHLYIAFYLGDQRRARFDLQVSDNGSTWTTLLAGVQSSGTSAGLETFDFPDVTARFIRYVGHGNSANLWNSLTRFEILPRVYVESAVKGVSASSYQSGDFSPRMAVDSNLASRWSAVGDGEWLRLDLGSRQLVGYVEIAFLAGDTRQARFDLQTSGDGSSWNTVFSGQSSGTTTAPERFDFTDRFNTRYVRFVGHGNTTSSWNSITDIAVYVASYASRRVYESADGRLVRPAYSNGDRIPDFSRAGYGGGGVAIPELTDPARVHTVSEINGDDTATIQAAIDTVSGWPLGPDGFRGVVRLRAGTWEVAGALRIDTSGVVLRGEGDHTTGTVIKDNATTQRALITVTGAGTRQVVGAQIRIADAYVPVGSHTLTVADASGFAVGDAVVVQRTPNQQWIDAIGTDKCDGRAGTSYDTSDVSGSTCIPDDAEHNPWQPTDRYIEYERTVTAVDGNRLTFDSPMVEAFQSEFGGGRVYRYTYPGRISRVGVERIRAESRYSSATDENHGSHMIRMSGVEHGWVRDVTSRFYVQGTFFARYGTRYVTVQDSASLDHKSQLAGSRRYPFSLDDASHMLIMRNVATAARHDFVTGSNTPGPNVFLDSRGVASYSELGPHHRWATGSLFDNIVHNSVSGDEIIGAYNRGNYGSGHGWSGAYQVFYNCVGDTHKVASPPYARNWSLGCASVRREGGGEFDAYGGPVAPWSLYLAQLRDRLGDQALRNIGY